MNWYYVEGGQQAGPFDQATFTSLVESGKIRGDTLVWREGMAEWLPYQMVYNQSQAQPAGAPPQMGGADVSACVECGRTFPNDEMISYGTAKVCAECKPVFLQKVAEGVPVRMSLRRRALPVDADALIEEINARDYDIDIGSCISRGWNLVKANFGTTVLATFLVMLCSQAGGFIPLLGIIISLLIPGPLFGGLNIFYLKMIRGESVTIGDAFSGFSRRFWTLCGTYILMMIVIYACLVPAVLAAIPNIANDTAPGPLVWILGGLGVIGMIYLAISCVFVLPLCADLELGPWDSIRTSFRVVSKHWFPIFGLVFIAGLLSMLGLLACIIGVFVTFTIYYAATLYAYEDIFGVKS